MIAEVQLWGRTIGAVSLDQGREIAAFQYDREFASSGIESLRIGLNRAYGVAESRSWWVLRLAGCGNRPTACGTTRKEADLGLRS